MMSKWGVLLHAWGCILPVPPATAILTMIAVRVCDLKTTQEILIVCSALSILDRHSFTFVCLPTADIETIRFLVPAFFLQLICSSADDGTIHDSRQDL